jgi:lipoprotein signal peptidase
MKKIFYSILSIIFCIIITQLLNHLIIEQFVIGDACDYDTNGKVPGIIFNLFYKISSNTGYHSEPTLFNFYFTTFLGIVFGIFFALKYFKSN